LAEVDFLVWILVIQLKHKTLTQSYFEKAKITLCIEVLNY